MSNYFTNMGRDSMYGNSPDKTAQILQRLGEVDLDLGKKANVGHSHNLADLLDIDQSVLALEGHVLSFLSGKWKPAPPGGGSSSPGSSYILELTRWGVKSNGTNAVSTTKGLNDAMAWAVLNGYTTVVLPKGTYLIDKDSRVEPPSFLTLDLNGSTLKKETNGYEGYAVISFRRNQKYSRVTNGIIQGDRTTHDYTTITGTHEGGYGVEFGSSAVANDGGESGNNAKSIKIDNLEIYDCTGDSVNLISEFGQIFPVPTTLASSWESGGINATTGALEVNANKIRSNQTISMTQSKIVKYGYFGLYGNGYGALGSDIKTDYYDVFFYRADNSFISTVPFVQFFEEVEVPSGANYARVMLHQPTIPAPANCTINVRTATFPTWIFIENCDLHHSRRQGISVCGAKNVYIRDNNIHHIGGSTTATGTAPMSGIDVEDGYDLNQYIHIDNNNFHHNERYNIIVVNGKHIHITNNTLLANNTQGYVSLAINGGVDKAVVTGNIIKISKVSIVGETLFYGNYVYGTQVTVNPVYDSRAINVDNNIFHNCKYVFDSPFAFLVNTTNCRFINDAEKVYNAFGIGWTMEFKNQPQTVSNCQFEGQDSSYLTYAAAGTYVGGWVFENCRFKNTKTPSMSSGIYKGCIFTDLTSTISVTAQTGGNDSIELINCRFYSTDSNNTFLTVGSMKSFKMLDCYMEKTSGWLLKIGSISGEVVLSGNTYKILNDALPRAVVTLDSTFTGSQIVIENNKIACTNSARVGIDNLVTNNATIIIRGNTLTKATINRAGKEVMSNNILDGVVDPYFKSTAIPTTGYYVLGQEIKNTTPTSGGYLGWVCTTAGTANNTGWVTATPYALNAVINANGKVYKCTVAGTSGATAPTHTTGTAVDGTVTWQYVDTLAVFKSYGLIS